MNRGEEIAVTSLANMPKAKMEASQLTVCLFDIYSCFCSFSFAKLKSNFFFFKTLLVNISVKCRWATFVEVVAVSLRGNSPNSQSRAVGWCSPPADSRGQ